MSIKTKESLNCPCNGIYKCGLHSVPTLTFEQYCSKDMMDKILEEYNK